MANYRYEAVDNAGKVVRGVMNAPDEQAVAQRLVSMGFVLRSIVQPGTTTQQAAAVASAAAQPQVKSSQVPVSVAPVVSIRSLARFYRQLATLVRAGMDLGQALADMERATHAAKLRRAVRELAGRVQAGESLSSAMARFPLLFPTHTVGVIWAGELGGYLDIALDEAATELETEAKDGLWAAVGWGFAYFNIISLILMLPVINVAGFFTKVTLRMGEKMGDSLIPDPGAAANAVVEEYVAGFIKLSVPTLIASIILFIVWRKLKRLPPVRKGIDSVLLGVPNWGNLHRERARARFTRTLSQLANAGVSTAQAWAAASMTVRNSVISTKLRGLDELLRRPEGNLREALQRSGVFAPEDVSMIGTGEHAGAVPEMLERVSDEHNENVAKAKIAGRLVSINILILALTIAMGYFVIGFVSGFYRVGAKFGGLE
jgi:type IV pilus assembly protein PilC